ncbi:MAG: sodium-dependent bicarbonate transport family permease [Phycisphaeraceae bacterium]|nr:sodium-dependent bicarbonate transport family permease [Phycisphaeraceae bacterium]
MNTLMSPPILFFVLGMLATLLRTGLRVPYPIPKLLSLYLLFAIGFRGGVELEHGGITREVGLAIGAGVAMSVVVPLAAFWVLRRRLSVYDAGAVAATYGSVSAVTFITAQAVLDELGIAHSGSMVATMVFMESPAIITAVLLVRMSTNEGGRLPWGKLLHESFLNGPVFLLLGSMAVGLLTGSRGDTLLRPFYQGIFTGILCFFLLDLGLLAAQRLRTLAAAGAFGIGFAVVMPVLSGLVGMALARVIGLGTGDALLFTVLCGSASYIAVPAAIRLVVPQANAGLYIPMALGITFPLNVTLGIPLYLFLIKAIWRAG